MLYLCSYTIPSKQCWSNVEDVGPTLYKCYTNVLCLLGIALNFFTCIRKNVHLYIMFRFLRFLSFFNQCRITYSSYFIVVSGAADIYAHMYLYHDNAVCW